MQPILKQEKFLDTQQDTQRLEDLYTKEDLYPQDFLIIHTLRNRVTTKPCFSPCQSNNEDSFWMGIGTSKKARLLLSLTATFTLLSLLIFLVIGLSLGLAITVTAASLALSGLLLHLMNSLWYIENYTYLKSLPQIWQI